MPDNRTTARSGRCWSASPRAVGGVLAVQFFATPAARRRSPAVSSSSAAAPFQVSDDRLRLPPRHRRDQPLAGAAHRAPHAAGDRRQLRQHRAIGEKEYYAWMLAAAGRDARRVRRARPAAVLRLLRADPDPDVLHHRHLGRARAPLRRGQVLPLHVHRLGLHAGRRRSTSA